jgi:hypothetical protein
VIPAAIAAAVCIEGVLLTAATIWFGDPAVALRPLEPLIVVLLIAAVVVRLCDRVAWLRAFHRPIFFLGVALTALFWVRPAFLAESVVGDFRWVDAFANLADPVAAQPHAVLGLFVLSLISWSMASRLARFAGEKDQRRRAFVGEFIVLVSAVVLGVLASQGTASLSGALALLVPAYVICGMFALAQMRLADLRARLQRVRSVDRRDLFIWNSATMGMIAVTVAFFLLGVAIFDSSAYALAAQGLAAGFLDFLHFFGVVLGLIAYPFIALLAPLFSRPRNPINTPSPLCATPAAGTGTSTSTTCYTPPPALPLSSTTVHIAFLIVLFAVVLAVLVVVLVRTLWRQTAPANETFFETREALPSTRVRLRTPRMAAAVASDPAPPGSVRAIYRDVLARGAQAGLAREEDETTTEYAARIAPLLESAPTQESAISASQALTHAYEAERYGDVAPTPARVAEARTAAQRIIGVLGAFTKPKSAR